MGAVITADTLSAWIARAADGIGADADRLTELDSAIGDADHGINMVRGFSALRSTVSTDPPTDIQALLKSVGLTLVTTVGGASGSLYGTFFLDMGRDSPAEGEMTPAELESALRAGLTGVIGRGHAQIGDKTMVDALEPAVAAFALALARGLGPAGAGVAAAAAAAEGRDSTAPLVARKGRASYLGERSVGHIDPGSASTAIIVQALSDSLSGLSA